MFVGSGNGGREVGGVDSRSFSTSERMWSPTLTRNFRSGLGMDLKYSGSLDSVAREAMYSAGSDSMARCTLVGTTAARSLATEVNWGVSATDLA